MVDVNVQMVEMRLKSQWSWWSSGSLWSCPTSKTGRDHYGIMMENISSGNVMCKHSAPESQETSNGEMVRLSNTDCAWISAMCPVSAPLIIKDKGSRFAAWQFLCLLESLHICLKTLKLNIKSNHNKFTMKNGRR